MKDVMIITSYFPPEIGAASNRISHLAHGLKNDYNVTVVTPLPNYPTGKIFKEYRGLFKKTEDIDGLTVKRLWIYATVSKNKLQRLIGMLSYSFSLIRFFAFNKAPKIVIVQSPPLLVAFTCMLFLHSKKRKLILNVSDLWPSAGLELGALKANYSYRILQKIECFNYRKANLIMGQSEEIILHIKSIYNEKQCLLYRNFPDFNPILISEISSEEHPKIKLVYAGLLGFAQGILNLCKELKYEGFEFHIYGSGSEEHGIKTYISANPHLPVFFYGQRDRNDLHKSLINYDLTIIPLLNRIYGSVPSKIFEYAKLGLPMLYFGGGEGESIVKENKLGWVCEVKNYEKLNLILRDIKKEALNLSQKQRIQKVALERFDFNRQLDQLKKLL